MADAKRENERMTLDEYQRNCQGHLPGAVRLWVEDLEREKAELETRVEQLRQALEFYADRDNWRMGKTSTARDALNFPGMWDWGEKAWRALSDLKKGEEA